MNEIKLIKLNDNKFFVKCFLNCIKLQLMENTMKKSVLEVQAVWQEDKVCGTTIYFQVTFLKALF